MFVELIMVKSKPGIMDEAVHASATKIQSLAAGMRAHFERKLLQTADREWVEIAHWASQEEAQRVEQAVMAMPEAQEAMSVMDESCLCMMFLHPVKAEAQ